MGVCSTRNLELVQNLGADRVIDYSQEDFTQLPQKYDIVFDAVGKSKFSLCKKILTENGLYLTTVPNIGTFLHLIFGNLLYKKKVKFMATGMRSITKKLKDLEDIREMFVTGALKPTIDQVISLEKIAQAHEYVAKGHKRGSVVITIE